MIGSTDAGFRALVQGSRDIIVVTDESGRVTYISPAISQLTRREPADVLGSVGVDFVHPDDLATFAENFTRTLENPGVPQVFEMRIRHADGHWIHIETVATNQLDHPAIRGIVGQLRDISERRASEERLRVSEQRLRGLVEHAFDLVSVIDEYGNTLYVGPSHEKVLGISPDRAYGAADIDALHPDDRDTLISAFLAARAVPGGSARVSYRFRHFGDGSYHDLDAVLTNRLDDPAIGGIVMNARDVTEERAAQAALAHQALHDPLTGLPNRALLSDRIERALARGQRTGLRTVALFIDLDRFKTVNDSLGHAYGDELLVVAARRLREQVRATDTVARLGGDEFVVLLEDVAHERVALDIAAKVLAAIRAPFVVGGRDLFVTASIGLAIATSTSAATPDTIIRDADAAMYDAKARGRDRLEVFDEAIRARVLRRAETEQDLHRALDRAELALVYQPSFELRTGRVAGVEALLRWHHPRRGLVGPTEFIDVAEDTGLVVPIGEWVLDEACRQAARWRALGIEPGLRTVWVNLSARQLVRPELPDVVAAALARHDLAPDALGLEITESTLIEEAETPGEELAALEALGVRLAIDDFGTGYSSLLYLRRYRVDVLKLDRSFVSGLGTDDDDTAISAAVIDLGHALGMEISAEGIERERQWDRLRELGCDTACGFHLMRPTNADAITRLLRGQSAAAGRA